MLMHEKMCDPYIMWHFIRVDSVSLDKTIFRERNIIYQIPLILTALLPDKHCLSHGMCLYQVVVTLHFMNDVAND